MSEVTDRMELERLRRDGRRMLETWHPSYRKHRVQELLLQAQNERCAMCGDEMLSPRRHPESGDRWTLDHVWPMGLGGRDLPGNYVMVHSKCNARKGGRRPSDAELEILKEINTMLGWPTAPGGI